MTELITDEEIAELEALQKSAEGGGWSGIELTFRLPSLLPKLLSSLKALKAANEKLSATCNDWGKTNLQLIKDSNDFVNELLKNTPEEFDDDVAAEAIAIDYVRWLEAELERVRNVCVALESHIADSSLARFRHENVDRFVPEPGYPNGTDSEIEVASPFEIHPEGVPTR